MSSWSKNLEIFFQNKEVLILHGNVRDTFYYYNNSFYNGLTSLIKKLSIDNKFKEIRHITFIKETTEIQEIKFNLESSPNNGEIIKSESSGQNSFTIPILQSVNRWLQDKQLDNTSNKKVFIIDNIDIITPYRADNLYFSPMDKLVISIQECIDTVTSNNRVILIAQRNTNVPINYYYNSPKVKIIDLPIPDKDDRKAYLKSHLNDSYSNNEDTIDFLSNITNGLFLKDIDNIVYLINSRNENYSNNELKKIVNLYKIGIEDDKWTKLPLEGSTKSIFNAENWFNKRIKGQEEAVKEVVKGIKKARAGVGGLLSGRINRPKSIYFFAGPSGTGKTFLAKKLAEFMFDSEDTFIRLDMSEFKEEHSISKLIGSPPGYVGHERGGQLTNLIKRKPFSVILFDEIEKAHPKILDIFLQILDDGILTDSMGEKVYFSESIIIFTSNIGTRKTDSNGNPINEKEKLNQLLLNSDFSEEELKEAIKKHFEESVEKFFTEEISRVELLNRIGSNIIPFNYISNKDIQKEMIRVKLDELKNSFNEKFRVKEYSLNIEESVVEYILNKYSDSISRFGGRGLINSIEDDLAMILADRVLQAERQNLRGIEFYLLSNGDELNLQIRGI